MTTIASVRPLVVHGGSRNWIVVRVEASDGLAGIGEATLEWHTRSVVAAVEELAELAVGRPPERIHDLWQMLFRRRFFRGGPVVLSALSGIEQALWDLKGKRAGLPVYDLLGGACRDRLLVYGNHPDGLTPAELAADLERTGLRAVKITPVETALDVDAKGSALTAAIETTAALREAIGPGVRLAIDLHGRLSPSLAVVFARAVEELDIWFLEEPALPENVDGLSEVARATSIPVAAGERVVTRAGFLELLRRRAVALVQPDLAHCGGIFEGRMVAGMAEAAQVGFAPHNPLSPVNTLASAHVSITAPNFVALEYKALVDAPWRADVFRSDAEVVDGYLHLPAAPGLGVELDLEACAEHPYRPIDVPELRREDGGLAEW